MVFAIVADPAHCQAPVEAWVRRYNTPAETTDTAKKLAIDGSGNVFVAGTGHNNFTTIKYSAAGTTFWTNVYSGPGNAAVD